MKQKPGILYFVLLLAVILPSLFSCSDIGIVSPFDRIYKSIFGLHSVLTDIENTESSEVETKLEQTEQLQTENAASTDTENSSAPPEEAPTLTVYPNSFSDEYRLLSAETEQIETTSFIGAAKNIRFRAETDGVNVTLERLKYEPSVGFYRSVGEEFSIIAEKGKIYEFRCPVLGDRPDYRLTVELGEKRAVYYIRKADGSEDPSVELYPSEWEPRGIWLTCPEMAIAKAVAIADARYGGIYSDDICRQVIACAVAAHRSYEYTDKTEYFETDRSLVQSYLKAAYPEKQQLPQPDGDLLLYGEESDEVVRTKPLYYSGIAAASVFDISENDDGSVTVRFDIIVYSSDSAPKLCGRAVTLIPSHDENSPFDYYVSRVDTTDVEY